MQISMNVVLIWITVPLKLPVLILMVASSVSVTLDTLEMESVVQVCSIILADNMNVYQHISHRY